MRYWYVTTLHTDGAKEIYQNGFIYGDSFADVIYACHGFIILHTVEMTKEEYAKAQSEIKTRNEKQTTVY